VDALSVGFTQGKLIVDDHLDGEGAECILSPSQLHVQQMAREQRKLVSVFGSASCQAEENAPQVNFVYLLYSRQTDGTEILIFADGSSDGSTELLRRKSPAKNDNSSPLKHCAEACGVQRG
jgi:hypothetical protein